MKVLIRFKSYKEQKIVDFSNKGLSCGEMNTD